LGVTFSPPPCGRPGITPALAYGSRLNKFLYPTLATAAGTTATTTHLLHHPHFI
jgi:hypothetical protein